MDEKIKNILDRLSKSKFRSSFHLKDKDILYIENKGIDKIREHAYDFVTKRLADTFNVTDGKQTPMKGHPVFIAQHARENGIILVGIELCLILMLNMLLMLL